MAEPMDPLDAAWDAAPGPKAVDPLDAAWDAAPAAAPAPTIDVNQRAEQLRGLMGGLRVLTQDGVDRHASVLRLAQQTGMRFDVAEKNFDDLDRMHRLAAHDPAMWMKANPELTDLIFNRPELAPVVIRDHQANIISRAFNWLEDQVLPPLSEKELKEIQEAGGPEKAFDAALGQLSGKLGVSTDTLKTLTDAATPLSGKSVKELTLSYIGAKADVEAAKKPQKEALVQDAQSKSVTEGDGWTVVGGGMVVPTRLLVPGYRFSEAWQQMKISRSGYSLMLARGRGDEAAADAIESMIHEQKLDTVKRDYQEGEAGRVFSSMATAAASTLYGLQQGATIGSTAAGIAGLGILAYTRNPEAATAGAVRIGALFGKAGAVKGTFELEAGNAYLSLLQTKDVNGQPLDERTARIAAGVYGVLASGIEFASWGPMLKAMGPLGEVIKTGELHAFSKALLTNDAFKVALRAAGKEWLPAAGAEGFEEGLQDAVEQALTLMARGEQLGAVPSKMNVRQSTDAAAEGFTGSLGLAGFGVGTGILSAAMQRDAAITSGKTVELFAGLAPGPGVRAAPQAIADMVKAATAKGGDPVTTMHVDPDAFVRLYQGAKADPDAAIRQLMGDEGPKKLQEALAGGTRLEIPVADYLEKWGGTETARALAPYTSTSATAPLLANVEKTDQEISELAKVVDKEAPASEAEAEFISAAEGQLEAVQGEGRNAARAQMNLWRALVRTMADKFGVDGEKMFQGLTLQIEHGDLQDLSVPQASEALAARLASKEGVDRGAEFYLDQLSGLRNRRAFEALPVPEGHQVAVITSSDTKGINDNPIAGGHDVANELLRTMGHAIGKKDPEAARAGTNFLVYVKDQEHLDQVLERVRAHVGQGITVEGALAENTDKALAAAKTRVDQQREAGAIAPRGEVGKGVDVTKLKFAPGRAAAVVPAHLVEQLNKMGTRQYFERVYVTKGGLLTAEGRAALPRKKHQLIFDIKGLGLANSLTEKPDVGDSIIAEFERVMVQLGASDLNGAHLSGDEFVAEHDDPKELAAFVTEMRRALKGVNFRDTVKATGEEVSFPVAFRHGIGEGPSLDKADRALNQSRRAETRLAHGETKAVQGGPADLGPRERAEPRPGRGRSQAYPRRRVETSPLEKLEQGSKLFAGAGDKGGPRGYSTINLTAEAQKLFKVALNKDADLTTFLHESAHIFLKLFSQAAEQLDAPQAVRDDYATALKWLGADNFAQLTVDQHEKWAKGFERYLLEGNAPSGKLVAPFERFKLWLKGAYTSIKDLAGLTEINDDIRGVFDRLLATDQEIRRQRNSMGMGVPMAKDLLGMSDEDYVRYLKAFADANSHAQRQAELTAAKEKLREQETWWKEQRRKAVREAEIEYEYMPARQAELTLRGKGELWGDTPSGAITLNRAMVVAAVGDVEAKKFKTREGGGVDPDDVADFMGYRSGKLMLDAILALPEQDKFVKQYADQLMADKYGDVLAERQRLREIVGKGLHGEMTAKVLLRERAALMTKAGAGQTRPVDTIRAAAHKAVSGRAIGRLDAGAALAAERKAANASAAAAAKGNYALALIEKEKQLLNMFTWRELVEARDDRESFLELAGKLSTEKYRQRLGKGHPIYLGGSDFILEQLGLKNPSPRVEALPSIGEVVSLLERENETVGFDEQLLEQALVKPREYKTLTVDEMRQVFGALKTIKAAARNKATVLIDGKRMAKEDAIARLQGDAAKNLPPKPPPPTRGAETIPQWLGGKWNAIDGELRKPEFLLERLGGRDIHSAWHQFVVKQLQAGKHDEADLFTKYGEPLIEALKKLATHKPMQMIDGDSLFPSHTKKAAAPQRRFELLLMLLNAGNESNLARLAEGRSITEQQLRDAAKKVGITKDEYDAIQGVWDAFEELGKASFDLEERDSGLRPEKIQAREFSTPFGKYRGGYFPAVYDFNTTVGARQEAQQLMDPGYVRPGTAKGHLKSRVEGFSDVISLEPGALTRHIAQAVHDLAFRERLRSVANLLGNEDVAATMRERLGAGRANIFPQYLRDIGWMRGGEQSKVPQLAGAMRWVRGNLMSVLGYSLPNALEDYATNLSTATLGTGLKVKHLAAALATVKAYDKTAMAEAEARSGELRSRHNQVRRELLKQQEKLIERSIPGRRALRYYKDHSQIFAEIADRASSAMVWIAAERQYLEEHQDEGTEEKVARDAVDFADTMVRKVLVSHSVVDQSALMRDKGAIGAFIIFHGFFNHAYNRVAGMVDQAVDAETSKEAALAIGEALGFMAAVFVVGSIVRGQGPGNGDEPDDPNLTTAQRRALKFRNYAVRKLLVGTAEIFPFLGPLAQAGEATYTGKKDFAVRNNSFVGICEGVAKSYLRSVDENKPTDARVKALMKLLEPTLGVPVSQQVRSGSYLWDWYQGNEQPRGPGDVAGGVIYGQRSDQAANVPTMLQDLAGP